MTSVHEPQISQIHHPSKNSFLSSHLIISFFSFFLFVFHCELSKAALEFNQKLKQKLRFYIIDLCEGIFQISYILILENLQYCDTLCIYNTVRTLKFCYSPNICSLICHHMLLRISVYFIYKKIIIICTWLKLGIILSAL